MIDAQHHIELNGVKYRIAEDAEGDAYALSGESLRPPNSSVVQGFERQKFQMRPDILLWTLTDFSGGEGQSEFDPTQPNRMWRLDNVESFLLPGRVYVGPRMIESQDSTGAADFTHPLTFAHAMGSLWGVDVATSDNAYEWDESNEKWGAAVNNSVASATKAALGGAAGDPKYLYYIEEATGKVYTYDGSSWALLGTSAATGNSPMVAFGDYLYILDLTNFKVHEMSKVTGTETELVDFSSSETIIKNEGQSQLFVGDERVYFMQVLGDSTVVWEVTPSGASGTGFGREVLRYDGLQGEASWYHMGTIFTVGVDNSTVPDQAKRVIMYWQTGGQYGTLGPVRSDRNLPIFAGPAVSGNAQTLLTSSFMVMANDPGSALQTSSIFVIDAPSGGFAVLTDAVLWEGATEQVPADFVEFNGRYFASINSAPTKVLVTVPGQYNNTSDGLVETPEFDFDLAEEKTLTSISIACEKLDANASLEVAYSIDGGNYVTVGTLDTDDSVGTTFVVSTDTSVVSFNKVRIRVQLLTTTTGETPVLTAINVRAKALQQNRRWRLLLDCSDDQSGTSQSFSGAHKIENVETVGTQGGVVDLKDGYQNRIAGEYEQVDVTVEDYRIVLSRAGEGVAFVELAEVV